MLGKLTSVCDLTGVAATCPVTKLRHGRSDLAERFSRSSVSWTLISCQCDFLLFAGLRILELGDDGHDFIVEPACFLRDFCSSETLSGILVLRLPGDVKV